MKSIDELLILSKNTAILAFNKLEELDRKNIKSYSLSSSIPREFKSDADHIIEKILIDELSKSDLNILSEESGLNKTSHQSSMRFIIDPIDGTVNFLRGIHCCSISIALFDNDEAIFGVLALYPSGDIVWGGKDIGSFINGKSLKVSSISNMNKSILCTGFPSRFRFNSSSYSTQMELMSKFSKVRMLGSASQSLFQVAKGSVECYSEEEIMFWDVAAGIAIVEGAGGRVKVLKSDSDFVLKVTADNGLLDLSGLNK